MIAAVFLLLLGIIVTLAIIAANGYFVAQEFAYMSVDRVALRARAADGDESAERALRVTRRTSFMLSGAQLGITVTGLLVGYVAEPLIGESIGTMLGGIGVPSGVGITVGTVFALVAATIVQMIIGELYPKNLAIANAEPLARRLARSTLAYLTVFGWLIAVFDRAANGILWLLRIKPIHDLDTSATPEDLRRAVADSRESGHLSADLSLMIDRALDFRDRDVDHAMMPRAHVDVVSHDATVADVRALMAEGHTRYPVVDEDGDPVGIVELIALLRDAPADEAVARDIMSTPTIVPTLMSLPTALDQLVQTRSQMACVIDEYGGFAGLVTIEDLAEELVGEITDEHDETPPAAVREESEGTWTIDGDVHLDEVQRVIAYGLPEGDFETFAGLVIAQRGDLPGLSDRVSIPLQEDPAEFAAGIRMRRSLEVDVLEIEHHVPSLLRAQMAEREEADVDESEADDAGEADEPDDNGEAGGLR